MSVHHARMEFFSPIKRGERGKKMTAGLVGRAFGRSGMAPAHRRSRKIFLPKAVRINIQSDGNRPRTPPDKADALVRTEAVRTERPVSMRAVSNPVSTENAVTTGRAGHAGYHSKQDR